MHLQDNTFFDLGVAQYPKYHVTYAATKFEVAMSNGLGRDTFTRNVMTQTHDADAQTDIVRRQQLLQWTSPS